MVTLLVKDLYSSYRDYPAILYQIQTKYRDEARPRAGLLRGREFLMKDSYSFDLDQAGLDRSYLAHRATYQRILDRLGLRYTVVAATSGAMGGSRSEEFLAETPVGEDTYVGCAACGYAANTEAVTTPAPPAQDIATAPPLQVHDTPDTPTIETLATHANTRQLGGRDDWAAADTLKNVALAVRAPGAANRSCHGRRVSYPAPMLAGMSSRARLRRQAVGWSLARSTGLAEAMARLEFVQADPIRAPAPAQDLILRHRVPRYRVGDLDRAYPSLALEEDVLYAYGFVARRLRRLLHPRAPEEDACGAYVPGGLAAEVLAFVRKRGVTHPRTVQDQFGRQSVVNGWGGRSAATTQRLETLHRYGLLRVARRERGVRLYEPAAPLGEPLPPPQRLRGLVLRIAGTLAPVPEATLRAVLPGRLAQTGGGRRAIVAQLVASGELASTIVDGLRYVWPADLPPVESDPDTRVRFLAPFDPVVWDRRRFEHLWGWAYRFEAYTPPAKRRLGYYAMPLLWRDQVIGWANCSHGTEGTSVEVGFVDGPPRQRRFATALDAEMSRLETFLR